MLEYINIGIVNIEREDPTVLLIVVFDVLDFVMEQLILNILCVVLFNNGNQFK